MRGFLDTPAFSLRHSKMNTKVTKGRHLIITCRTLASESCAALVRTCMRHDEAYTAECKLAVTGDMRQGLKPLIYLFFTFLFVPSSILASVQPWWRLSIPKYTFGRIHMP